MSSTCISVILPVYNEEGNIAACLRGLTRALQGHEHELLICYDFDEDRTLPAIAAMEDRPPTVKLVRNRLGRGAAFAIRAGLQAARGDVLVTTMADLSDPPDAILLMARKIREEGADVVSGSRYMDGGSQTGGPPFKVLLSRGAGLSLHWIAGLGTHDATTNFRAYSRRLIRAVDIDSRHGMELALELTVKAHRRGFKVDEVPSSWKDRAAGESRFRLMHWLPRYLRWYFLAMGAPIFVWGTGIAAFVAALVLALSHAPPVPFWPDEWAYVPLLTGRTPLSLDWLLSFHNEHRIPLPKLVWWIVGRASGIDARWGVTLNVGLLAAAAAVLVLGIRRTRGRTVWTDAFIPLLLLHWGHWENMTWPFQVAFVLDVFLLALLIAAILGLKHRTPAEASRSIGVPLVLLALCGGFAVPFVAVLAPWWIWLAFRGDPSRRGRRLAGPTLALLLAGAGLIGYSRPVGFPSSPGIPSSLQVSREALAAGLGSPGARFWPSSGWIAVAAALVCTAFLLRGYRRQPESRNAVAGIGGVLAGLIGLALILGITRAGLSPFFGFTERYVTLFCLFPFLLFTAAELFGRPLLARIVQIVLFSAAALVYLPNAERATDDLAPRRRASEKLVRDVREGKSIRDVAAGNPYWCPGRLALLEDGLVELARTRTSIYRLFPPPAR
ncbi:MAG TPA: glycosyltransferase [Planctomycetota bacterium]|nr:glycosyltransferase [Planctomycetota bacterium]